MSLSVCVCSGGSGWQGGQTGIIVPGGTGGRTVVGQDGSSIFQGGEGFNGFLGDQVGGSGSRTACDLTSGECTQLAGGSGQHAKGPGGNSGN